MDLALARDLVAIDSRSSVSNLPIAERVEAALAGFEIERLDYQDPAGVAKRALVAHRGPPGGLALSGHMDTVPDTGWTEDPWSARVEEGLLRGLGAADMKGPLAACIAAAVSLPPDVPATLLITTDEETTKQGARAIVARSELVKRVRPHAILVAEPTGMVPVRGHRANVHFTVTARGEQAHSSTGRGRNANWALVPFLAEMRAIFEWLRSDSAMQDAAYDPPFSDFNLVIDNHGTAVNVTVPVATVRIKFRYSARIEPLPVVERVRAAAAAAGLGVEEAWEGRPPELAAGHPLIALVEQVAGARATTAPYGTDASELSGIAPCFLLGPGSIEVAHKPGETIAVTALERAVPVFAELARRVAQV
ncbi:MAG: M20/M25/M40 family metallo-hydrolase [Rhodospirillales bacterium]|nr:M20/M25/M40 family metallo-hydrolase [Rhodospirillales bacterium]